MTEISIKGGKLAVELQSWDKLWSFKSRLEIPIEHIRDVRTVSGQNAGGIRAPGTAIPGLITAGTFYQDGKRVFWDVHNPAKAIAIDLRDERFSSLIIEVADPAYAIREIQQALTPAGVRS